MIARISILLFLLILVPDVYLYRRYVVRRTTLHPLWRWLWWIPATVLTLYTVVLCCLPGFAPTQTVWLNAYLLMLALLGFPKVVLALCMAIGKLLKKLLHTRRNYGVAVGTLLASLVPVGVLYGAFWGVRQLQVRHVDLAFDDLPAAFEGYRLVHITDLHSGTLPPDLLQRAVDSINAQHPDAVMITGDVQNLLPTEITPLMPQYRRIQARHGVFAVLGNHDYGTYVHTSEQEQHRNEAATIEAERQCGWQVLLNQHVVLRQGTDSIVVAGTENEGRPPFPAKANWQGALSGVGKGAFVIMLQHDPWAWGHSILPKTQAQLTLSGHTHGGQVSIFGWRFTQINNREDCGLYRQQQRALYVSSGLGGFLPFRLGVVPEIVVITLHRSA